MALYDTRFGLPQAVADYLNQGLPSIQQPYRPGYDKNYGPGEGMAYTTVMPQPGYQYVYGPDGQRYSIPIPGYDKNLTTMPVESKPIVDSLYPQTDGNEEGFSVYNPDPNRTRTSDQYSPYAYNRVMRDTEKFGQTVGPNPDLYYQPLLEGIPGAIQGYIKNSLPGRLIGKAVSGIESLLPVNQRAILENELLGQGFRLNDIGQIVSDGGNINTAENIMAGYNASKITADTFQKRRDMINEKMKDPVQKAAKLKALDEAEARILGTATDRATSIFDAKSLAKDPTYQSFDDLVAAGLLEGDDNDDEYEFDPTDPRNFFKVDPVSRKSAIDQEAANRNVQREIARRNAAAIAQEAANRDAARQAAKTRASSIAQETSNRDAAREAARKSAARKSAVAQEASNRDYARNTGRDRARDSAQSSATGRGATSATSSGLGGFGFSDIRLKENVELIGKSPSNINIYKFNYKDNPTTYQGAMAHEVPWASIKHSNGYMMVDYNKIDVDFKKYND